MSKALLADQPETSERVEPSAVLLEAIDLFKVFRKGKHEVSALNGVSVQLKRGSILSVIGPSGAGKSTLLQIMGGLNRPTSGSVELDGSDLYRMREEKLAAVRRQRIGFVFQLYHLLPDFTALENVMMPAMIAGKISVAEIRRRAAELLARVGLEDRSLHKPSELSGGESQRVAIARALMGNPDILLADEPTGNLDSATGRKIIDLLIDINRRENLSLVIVTHEESLRERAGTVIHIRDGNVVRNQGA
ncbi:MAG: ABC transporter ATP-binding protein [Candidatus Omnitrophota bacterium]